jgi:hypothetical protein
VIGGHFETRLLRCTPTRRPRKNTGPYSKPHRNLVAVGKYAYDEETYEELLPIAEAEYKMFLNKESMTLQENRIDDAVYNFAQTLQIPFLVKLLSGNEARRTAANIPKLSKLLRKP